MIKLKNVNSYVILNKMARIPPNPYPKGSIESRIIGQFISWFYYQKGVFPENCMDKDGFVPFYRFLTTKTFRTLVLKNPDKNLLKITLEILNALFDVQVLDGIVSVRKLHWPELKLHTSSQEQSLVSHGSP
jgi:hypothetical protein